MLIDSPTPALPAHSPRQIFAHVIAWIIILTATVYMLSAGWQRWNDPVVDFGRELYLPWQITLGKVLYRDLATFNGPLSPYVNAIWFKLFGVSLHTLIYCNIAITLAITAMLYRLAQLVAGVWAALASCLVFVLLCAYSQFGAFGNENYLAPYSHETTHGLALSLAALLLLHRFFLRPTAVRLACAGFFVGLVFLTKVEIFVAVASAVGLAWLLHAWRCKTPRAEVVRQGGALVASVLGPPMVACALLALAMPARDALLGTLGSLRHSFNSQLTTNVYFQEVTGLGDPLGSLLRAGAMWIAVALPLGVGGLIAWRCRGGAVARIVTGAAVLAATAGPLLFWRDAVPWPELSKSLTLWVTVSALVGLWLLFRGGHRGGKRGGIGADDGAKNETNPRLLLSLAWIFFAGGMLLKMILNVRLNHYGFALAMPAMTLFTVGVFGWLPDWLASRGGSAMVVRCAAGGVMFVFLLVHVQLSNSNHAAFVVPIASGRDKFLFHDVGRRASDVNSLLRLLSENTRPDETLAVFPEGVMINFLLRRPNPAPFTFYEPSDVMMFGEQRIIDAMMGDRPDYVVFIHKDTSMFGVQYFGRDYAQSLHAWVLANYQEVGSVGPRPFESDHGGVLVFARKK